MKKKYDNCRKIKRSTLLVLGCLAMGGAMLLQTGDSTVNAMTKEEAEQQKEEAKENEKSAKDILNAMEEQQNELVQEVADLDAQATAVQTEITKKQDEADEIEAGIKDTKKHLKEAQEAQDKQYEAMKQRIQYLYEEGDEEIVDAFITSVSFTDLLNKSEYIDQISDYDQKQLAKLIKSKDDIAQYEKDLEADLRQVESIKTDLENDNDQLQALIDKKQQDINKYSDDIDAQKSLMAKFTAQREEAERRIAEIARQEMIRARANGGGVLTDEFGYRDAPTAGASTYHQGLDIGCDYGTDIVAAEAGTVVMACYNGGGGNMVMISHGDGICTVYMHNSQLCVNVGEKVVKGQVIAKAGSTGVSTGPHCHFGVSIDGTYVNPHDFLGQ